MSDTPRTDKETYLDGTDTALIGVPVVPASFAQQLERDLCAALAEKHHWRDLARKAERSDVPSVAKWTSLVDRLPEFNTWVLAQGVGPLWGKKPEVMMYVDQHSRHGMGPAWVDSNGDDCTSFGEEDFGVTHWMPLPPLVNSERSSNG